MWVVVLGWADWDQLFVSQGDPSIVEHVDVTTGQLVLYREGVQAEGAVPLLLHRMYTSAEEKEEAKKIQSNICDLGSGWGLLPHLQLCIDPIGKALFAYTREPSGAFVGYQWTLEKSKQVLFFKSLVSSGARYGLLSGRSTAANHKLDVNIREGKATIHLADGGKRIYEGEGSFWMRTLQELQMPSFSPHIASYDGDFTKRAPDLL